MPRIKPARNGFTLVEMNRGRVQTVEERPEVVEIKREIEARWPGHFRIDMDLEDRKFIIVCLQSDGNEYLLFKTRFLNQQTIEQIARRDQASRGYEDVMERIEEGWKRQEREEDRALEEIAGDAAERLAWAFRKDGLIDHENIYGPRPKSGTISNRAIRPRREPR